MKIVFANDTLAKLKFLALSDEAGSGFLRTERLGQYVLITDLITGNIYKDSLIADLLNIYELWGNGFGGIFIKGEHDRVPPCFLEKLVVEISEKKYKIFYFNSDAAQIEGITEGSFPDHWKK